MPRKPDIPCASCGKLMWRGKGSLPSGLATCRDCRSATGASDEHGTRRMYRERGCRCEECRAWNSESSRAYNAKVRAETGLSYTARYKPSAIRPTVPADCTGCGASMYRTSVPAPLCAICRGQKPGKNIAISASERVAIYERDGWVCQICLDDVDPSVNPNTTWGATLDHIIPRASGGTDDRENLRLAHRWCNSVRGDLRYYTDADLRVA